MTSIQRLIESDFDEWTELWRDYILFYESEVPEEISRNTFRRILEDEELHGAIARDEAGRAIGLVHWLTHPATWSRTDYCYLEDLFVSPSSRGAGTGRALIAQVTQWARERGCAKVYWLTQETNATARALYDSVATHSGFTHYEIDL